jgi:hypothetical protein
MSHRILIPCIAVVCALCCAISIALPSGDAGIPDVGSSVDIARWASVRTWSGKPTRFTGCEVVLPTELKRANGIWTVTAAPGETSVNIGLE